MWDGKQSHKPKPVERPGINEKKRTGDASALTPAQVRSVLDRRKPIALEV